MAAGTFPFVRPEDDELKNVVQMQRMFTRIIEGDYIPLPLVSLASRPHALVALLQNSQGPCFWAMPALSRFAHTSLMLLPA